MSDINEMHKAIKIHELCGFLVQMTISLLIQTGLCQSLIVVNFLKLPVSPNVFIFTWLMTKSLYRAGMG